jgi:hypothetical protein
MVVAGGQLFSRSIDTADKDIRAAHGNLDYPRENRPDLMRQAGESRA